MKLNSLFPKSNSLVSNATNKKPSLFGTPLTNTSTDKSKKKAQTGLRKQQAEKRSGGLFSIKWPTMPKQGTKDYQVITKREDLIEYLNKCKETGLASFDWETAPEEETHARYKDQLHDFKIRKLQAKSELESAALIGLEELSVLCSTKKAKPAQKKLYKKYTDTIKLIEKDEALAEKAFKRTPLCPWQGKIVTLSIAAAANESRVIFIDHKKGSKNYGSEAMTRDAMTRDAAREEIMNLLEELIFQDKNIMKIAFNVPFETKFAAKYGKYIVGKVADPFVMIVRVLQLAAPQKIQSPTAPYMGKSLKKMTREYLGVVMKEFKDVVGDGFFDELSTDSPDAELYSAEDSDYALQLYLFFDEVAKQIPNKDTCPYKNYSEWLHAIEMPFGRVIGLMEYWGMQWNSDDAAAKRREAHATQAEASDKIKEICKNLANDDAFNGGQKEALKTVNPGKTGKTKDVKHVLYDILKIPVAATNKTGISLDNNAILDTIFMLENNLYDLKEEKYLTEELPEGYEAIVYLAVKGGHLPDEYNPEKPNNLERGQRVKIRVMLREPHLYKDQAIELLKTMQLIQKYSTLLSTHIEGREKYVNPVTGRIHANYSPWTQTSRLNSSTPNQQNVPATRNDVFLIRNLYKSAKGKVTTFIDFSGFELRLMAWRSACEIMIKAICDGADLHKMTAATLTGKIMELITKDERSEAKSGNFLTNYGGSEHALQATFKKFNIRKSLEECKLILDAVLNTYPGIPKYQREIVLEAREDGYVETIYGYKRLLPDINHPDRGRRGSDERRASNTPVQGSASDYMKDCQNIVYDRIGRDTYYNRMYRELGVNYVLGVTDELPALEVSPEDIIFVHGHFDMTANIHDEIIFECEDNENRVVKGMLWVKEIMERKPLPNFPVPIEAEASIGYTWGEKVDLDKWEWGINND